MPLEPAFTPLARPAPPLCLPSLYRARCLLLRRTACNIRPEGSSNLPGVLARGRRKERPQTHRML
eukprot:2789183-Prymnesium_polylepis.1